MQIWVQHKVVDGVHMYTTNDPLGGGLCAAHQNEKKAWTEARRQLCILLRENHDMHVIDQNLIMWTEEDGPLAHGSLVILDEVPASLLSGLPEEDQIAIQAIAGKPITLVGFRDDQVELKFADADGDGHTIWVAEGSIRPA